MPFRYANGRERKEEREGRKCGSFLSSLGERKKEGKRKVEGRRWKEDGREREGKIRLGEGRRWKGMKDGGKESEGWRCEVCVCKWREVGRKENGNEALMEGEEWVRVSWE